MDYSALPEDAESSPWSSSPRMTRRSLTNSDQPSSSDLSTEAYKTASSTDQLPSSAISNNQEASDSVGNGSMRKDHENHQRSSSSDEPQHQGHEAPVFEGSRAQARSEQKTQPQRYHSNVKTPARTNLPQYKLQAKVTGLERTGRKDPILRFDVHVLSS